MSARKESVTRHILHSLDCSVGLPDEASWMDGWMGDGVNRFQAYLSLSALLRRRPLFTLICAMSDRDFYASPPVQSNPMSRGRGEKREEREGMGGGSFG